MIMRNHKINIAAILLFLLAGSTLFGQGITASDLRTEYATNPLGVDTLSPRFSWLLNSPTRAQSQSAYRILVSASEAALAGDTGDQWDTGKTNSDRAVNVPYEGKPLARGGIHYWKVMVWDKDGKASPWSAPARFEMGLLNAQDWQGSWITAPPGEGAPMFRKTFELNNPVKRARVYVSALGWYELYINGKRIGDHVLDPAYTTYDRHALYSVYDVSDVVVRGRNAIGAILGHGYYSQPGKNRYGTSPKLLLQCNVEYAGGHGFSVSTDESWTMHASPITRNGIQLGESYDARLEIPQWALPGFDDAQWPHAVKAEGVHPGMEAQLMAPIKVTQTIRPVKVTNPEPGIYVYDLGQVFTGWTSLRLRAPAGSKVAILYSERLWADTGLLDKTNHPVPAETDYYIAKGDPAGEVYAPRFTFHTLRYVQLEGYPGTPTLDDLQGKVVHSAIEEPPHFESSNSLVNGIHKISYWTIQNALYGIFMDEPHREPFGYLEPGETPANAYSRWFMPLLWTKWLRDAQDEQKADGSIPVCIPNYTSHTNFDAAWSGNYPTAIWYLYQYYDDRRLLASHYDGMKRWMDYLISRAEPSHLVLNGTWGDHMLPGIHPGEDQYISKETPPELCWTGYYFRDALALSQAAKELGKEADARRYAQLAEVIRLALNDEWFDPVAAQYATGSQSAALFALALELVPKGHRAAVAERVTHSILEQYDGHLHTGHIGTSSAMEALPATGHDDVLYHVLTRTRYPGWGYMVTQGATTVWESWAHFMDWPRRGETMTMFATIEEFILGRLGGIDGPAYFGQRVVTPGFREISIRPYIPPDMDSAAASIMTVGGKVTTRWQKTRAGLNLVVTVPVNSRARIEVPATASKNPLIRESGHEVWRDHGFIPGVAGIASGAERVGGVEFDVGSGVYSFESSNP
jgi:alpha-L-rhamnosidase